jgi:hypothetical protein
MRNLLILSLLLGTLFTNAAFAAIVRVEAEDMGQVTRAGTWSESFGSVLSDGRAVTPWTTVPGSTLTLTFDVVAGSSISVFGRTCRTVECLNSNASISLTLDSGFGVSFSTYQAGAFTHQALLGSFSGLSAGTHTLVVADLNTSNNSQNVQIDFFEFDAASAVPVPASVWLFGSALIGLIGIKRKKGSDKLTS